MLAKWISRVYKGWLDLTGRPDFPYTAQLRNIAQKRPWLFIILAALLTAFFVWRKAPRWVSIPAAAGVTWLLLHIGGFC